MFITYIVILALSIYVGAGICIYRSRNYLSDCMWWLQFSARTPSGIRPVTVLPTA